MGTEEDTEDVLVLDDEDAAPVSFFPLRPHLLLMLKLIGFFSFFSLELFSLILATAAIFASISFFFLRMRSACSDMAASLRGLPSPGPGPALPLDHMTSTLETVTSDSASISYRS